MRKQCLVEPGHGAELKKRKTNEKFGLTKHDAEQELATITERLGVLHGRLWAEHARAVLLVLQGLDASGKDGTIRRVFTGLNPQGCNVESFKAPSVLEHDHDFLWRIHAALPRRGDIGIFNRSHYEDVVTTVVLGLIDDAERKRRYEHINNFEAMLHDEGVHIVKVFLHLGKEEQRARLQARLDDPEKHWKFQRDDLTTRAKWDDYQRLYDAAISATSTKHAPWFIVPADHKWVSGLAVAKILTAALEEMKPKIPRPVEDLDGLVVE